MKVLFVCSGNTCRSPLAEHLARRLIARRYPAVAGRFTFASAGTSALDGQPASEHARAVAGARSLADTLDEHRSRRLNAEMIRDADLILAMGQQHRAAVIGLAAEAEGRTFTLREYASTCAGLRLAAPEGGWDIADPFGCDRADYDRTATEIADALEPILAWLAAREDDGQRRTGP